MIRQNFYISQVISLTYAAKADNLYPRYNQKSTPHLMKYRNLLNPRDLEKDFNSRDNNRGEKWK